MVSEFVICIFNEDKTPRPVLGGNMHISTIGIVSSWEMWIWESKMSIFSEGIRTMVWWNCIKIVSQDCHTIGHCLYPGVATRQTLARNLRQGQIWKKARKIQIQAQIVNAIRSRYIWFFCIDSCSQLKLNDDDVGLVRALGSRAIFGWSDKCAGYIGHRVLPSWCGDPTQNPPDWDLRFEGEGGGGWE